jgi:hypothetical protein
MNTYEIEVRVLDTHLVTVKAANDDDAIAKAKQKLEDWGYQEDHEDREVYDQTIRDVMEADDG